MICGCFLSLILAISVDMDGGFLTESFQMPQEGWGRNPFSWETGVEGLGPRDKEWPICIRDIEIALLIGRGQPRSLLLNLQAQSTP